MPYSQSLGRAFWLAFDDYFKFESGQNGLALRYQAMGGYNQPGRQWRQSRRQGTYPDAFRAYVEKNREPIAFLASEQERFVDRFFAGDKEALVSAFRDFAFGILASPTGKYRAAEPVHTMNGGVFAQDYLSWHGFIESALMVNLSPSFWEHLRWVNGMAWELQAKARPQEIYPNQNEPLPDDVTTAIRRRWEGRNADEIAAEFENYDTRPTEWKLPR